MTCCGHECVYAGYYLCHTNWGTVVGGAASISQSGNTTTINQTSQNAVINWQSFNTNQNETAQFIQPNASSAALNRIMNGLPTT
ncbi:MAG: filamentous hemagglutinin, partial [Proteobacteria bacterium]|nr:filamentous hemagglutinin [Pseudomonadota bacterium]